MYEPNFRHSSALVCGQLHDLVIASSDRREDFRYPIGCATNPARIGLQTIADDEHIGLDNGINLVALFVGLGQTNIKRSNENAREGVPAGDVTAAAAPVLECIAC